MKFTLLGSGCSQGVPRSGGIWGDCNPNEPKNNRSRASLLVQSETTSILVDATPDFRYQSIKFGVNKLDAALLSHYHADHTSGIEDLRALYFFNNQKMIDVYAHSETFNILTPRFTHLFMQDEKAIYYPILHQHTIDAYESFRVGDIDVQAFEQDHVTCKSLGFRFGKLAYSVDVLDLSEKSLELLKGIDVWILDCFCYQMETPTTHANIAIVKKWVDIVKPKMTYINVLSNRLDYNRLCSELPPTIRPAYDGLVIEN